LSSHLPFDWDIEISNVMESEVDEFLQVFLSKMVLEALAGELLAFFHGE